MKTELAGRSCRAWSASALLVLLGWLGGCTPPPRRVESIPIPAPAPIVTATPVPSPSVPPRIEWKFPEVLQPVIQVGLLVHQASISLPKRDYLIDLGTEGLRFSGPLTLTPGPEGSIVVQGPDLEKTGGNSLRLASPDPAEFLRTSEGPYRGVFIVKTGTRGLLHLVNRVNLEDYLKGVVPAEMGPRVFDELEALKAQAIAARSYAARHRGESAAEGYDLCATPKCQVYSGAGAEQALSSRAVEETASEVLLFQDQVADTLFTSTCGGRTERAADVFPTYASANFPYLASVPCFGDDAKRLKTNPPRDSKPHTLLAVRGRALLSALGHSGAAYADLVAARNALRGRLGQPGGGGPKTLQPPVVYADLAIAGGLGDGRVLVDAPDIEATPRNWPMEARLGYAAALRFDLGGTTPLIADRTFRIEEVAGLYGSFLSRLGDFDEAEFRLLAPKEQSKLLVRGAKGREILELGPQPAFFQGLGDLFTPSKELVFFPGDRARIFSRGGKVSGIALLENGPVSLYDRDSSWSFWTRRFTGTELMNRMKERDKARPGKRVVRIEVLGRAVSGRVTRAKVVTDEGQFILAGLEIRFSLGVPENLFTFTEGKTEGEPIFTFHGRGWGHGVGLCQNGAFGLALAGKTYREILSHFYPGTAISKLDKVQSVLPVNPLPAGGTAGEERRNR